MDKVTLILKKNKKIYMHSVKSTFRGSQKTSPMVGSGI